MSTTSTSKLSRKDRILQRVMSSFAPAEDFDKLVDEWNQHVLEVNTPEFHTTTCLRWDINNIPK